jgi:hypothetical protein
MVDLHWFHCQQDPLGDVSTSYLSPTPRRGSSQKSGGVTLGAKQTSKRNAQSSLPTYLLTGSWLLLLVLVLVLSPGADPGAHANSVQQNKAKQTNDNIKNTRQSSTTMQDLTAQETANHQYIQDDTLICSKRHINMKTSENCAFKKQGRFLA